MTEISLKDISKDEERIFNRGYWLEEWHKKKLIKVLEDEICEKLQITKKQLKKYGFTELEQIIEKRSGKPMKLFIPTSSYK